MERYTKYPHIFKIDEILKSQKEKQDKFRDDYLQTIVGMGATVRDGESQYSPEGSRRTLMMQSKNSSQFGLKLKHQKVN